ncbi:MAG TPA: PEP-CTERM sorting domain-containing protein [Opitutus sp.]|nr:PEP-CTERM sorting domain-containing protein [Opitutus sp.]
MITRFPLRFTALSLTLLCWHLSAQVVNFNFMEDYNSTNLNFGLGAAPDDSQNDFWNRVGPDGEDAPYAQDRATMFASDGTTPTSIRVLFDGSSFGTGGAPEFAADLFQGYYYTGSSGAAFTITGLTAGDSYDFYFYSQSGALDDHRAAIFTFDGTDLTATAIPDLSFESGVNYVEFSVTPTGTSLAGFFTTAPGAGEADFAGVQVVTVSAVPEPSTYAAIAGLAGLGFAFIRQRRRAGQRVPRHSA